MGMPTGGASVTRRGGGQGDPVEQARVEADDRHRGREQAEAEDGQTGQRRRPRGASSTKVPSLASGSRRSMPGARGRGAPGRRGSCSPCGP